MIAILKKVKGSITLAMGWVEVLRATLDSMGSGAKFVRGVMVRSRACEQSIRTKSTRLDDPSKKAGNMSEIEYQTDSMEVSKERVDVVKNDFEDRLKNPRTVIHWYDFLCPFCYVGQNRTAVLAQHGLDVIELPFQAHPDIPAAGIPAGPRNGLMYMHLEWEAKEAGLSLNWPPHLPNTRRALAAADWVRRHQPESFPQFHKDLFAAHFVLGEDLGNPAVIDRHAADLAINVDAMHAHFSDGSAFLAVTDAETLGSGYGVQGTPAWLIGRRLISGLLPAAEFERFAEAAMGLKR
jgi:predicted DsbA family dithiol-disulfide isomerase